MTTPSDPDYRTLWPEGSLVSYDVQPDAIRVRVDGGPVTDELAVQQLVYTLQGAEGTDAPLEIEDTGEGPLESVDPAPQLEVLSHMSIDAPAEGQTVTGSLTVTGRSNGFEASVACFLYVGNDGGAYGPYPGMAEGWMEERLFPWELVIDLTREPVPPGDYTLTCSTDDPTGGTEGRGADVDTRTITVE